MADRYEKNLSVNRSFVAMNQFHRSQCFPSRVPPSWFTLAICPLPEIHSVSVARSCNDPLPMSRPGSGRLSFREICRPRPQPIRSSAAPVKFTSRVYATESCVTRRRLLFLLVLRARARKGERSGSQVAGYLDVSRQQRHEKEEKQLRDERFEPRGGRGESKGRLRTDTHTQVRERAFLLVPLGFSATREREKKQDGRQTLWNVCGPFQNPRFRTLERARTS